jgi:hypothetical protein
VKIDEELKNLQKTLANIEDARPFEDLTVGDVRMDLCCAMMAEPFPQVDDVAQARPEILKAVDTMMKKGKFSVPGTKLNHSGRIELLTTADRLQGEVWGSFYGVNVAGDRTELHLLGWAFRQGSKIRMYMSAQDCCIRQFATWLFG